MKDFKVEQNYPTWENEIRLKEILIKDNDTFEFILESILGTLSYDARFYGKIQAITDQLLY